MNKFNIEKLGQNLIFFQIICSLFIKFFIEIFHLPNAINYIMDVNLFLCLVIAIYTLIVKKEFPNFKVSIIIFVLLILWTIFSWIANETYPVVRYAMAARNLYRGMIFCFASIVLLKRKNFKQIINIAYVACISNLIISVYQFFAFGEHGDYISGIYGTNLGYNAYANLLIVFTSIAILTQYMNNETSIIKVGIILVSCCAYAAIAEIKFYFFELAVIISLIVILSKGKRKLFLLLGGSLFLIGGVCILLICYPGWKGWFFNANSIAEIVTGDGYSCITRTVSEDNYQLMLDNYSEEVERLSTLGILTTDENGIVTLQHLNRVLGISDITKSFLYECKYLLFGRGLGNTQPFSHDAIRSEFSILWSDLGYMGFSHLLILLETGVVGLIIYSSWFMLMFIKSVKIKKAGYEFEGNMGIISVLCCALICMYSSVLLSDGAYMMYLCLGMPYVVLKEQSCK